MSKKYDEQEKDIYYGKRKRARARDRQRESERIENTKVCTHYKHTYSKEKQESIKQISEQIYTIYNNM